ncbi:MAG: polysaccharide deacetylase family protein, partial [Solirubrobacterales bacterium]
LGEAAELELGAFPPDARLGEHPTVTEKLPALLAALGTRGLAATFFVEGLNAELYPDALREIGAEGHEVGFHAWRHEDWAGLDPARQADNLARGAAAFAPLGLSVAGMRPPGGQLGAGGLEVLREAGLRYCSPAGQGAGLVSSEDGDIALLPFDWRHVDASCVLAPLAPVRERIAGSPDQLDPGAFLAFLELELEGLARSGGFLAIVLHPFMLDWLGEGRLVGLLDGLARAQRRGDLWVGRCEEIAARVIGSADAFRDGASLDPTSWSG